MDEIQPQIGKKHIPYKVWDEGTYLFPKFNGEVW